MILLFSGPNSLTAKLCYALWMSVLYATFPGIYSIVAAAVNDAFGPAHYQANFGLLFSQSLAYCAVIMVLTKVTEEGMQSVIIINYCQGFCDPHSAGLHGDVHCGGDVRLGWIGCGQPSANFS